MNSHIGSHPLDSYLQAHWAWESRRAPPCFPQVPWLMEKKIQHLVANIVLCWKWQTLLNLATETSLLLGLLFCWLNSRIPSNLSSASHQHNCLKQTLWSASALMILTHTAGHAQPQRQGANRSPTGPDRTEASLPKEILETDWLLKSQGSSSRLFFSFLLQKIVLADQSAKCRMKFSGWWLGSRKPHSSLCRWKLRKQLSRVFPSGTLCVL